MKKLLHIVFAIMLFIFAVDSTEVFASSIVTGASVGSQQGIVSEGDIGDVIYHNNLL